MGANSSCLSETVELVSPFGECLCKGCSCSCGVSSKTTPEATPPILTRALTISPIDIAVRTKMIELEREMRSQILLSINHPSSQVLSQSQDNSVPECSSASSNPGPSLDASPIDNRALSITVPRWPTATPISIDEHPNDSRVI